jgi:dTDP-4-amino-4,6-dideoxygalactose transaminase
VSVEAALIGIAPSLRLTEDPRPYLREMLRRDYSSHSVVLCGSGTQALAVAIRESSDSSGSRAPVALPAFSCFDIATAAVGANVRVSFYDLDPQTLAPEPASLERVFRAGARVAVVAPLYGVPVDWGMLATIAEAHGALLIEDAAQGHGARFQGRRLGSIGKLAILSFGRGKGWTGGHGGALLVNDPDDSFAGELAALGMVQEARSVIGLAAQWALGRPGLYGIPHSVPALRLGETVYRAPDRARSLGRAAAAALLVTAPDAEQEAMLRRANAAALLQALSDSPGVQTIPVSRESIAGYVRLPLRLKNGMASFGSPDAALSLGIAPSYPRLLPELVEMASRSDGPERDFPGARTLVRELVTAPTHSRLEARDLTDLASTLRAARA